MQVQAVVVKVDSRGLILFEFPRSVTVPAIGVHPGKFEWPCGSTKHHGPLSRGGGDALRTRLNHDFQVVDGHGPTINSENAARGATTNRRRFLRTCTPLAIR